MSCCVEQFHLTGWKLGQMRPWRKLWLVSKRKISSCSSILKFWNSQSVWLCQCRCPKSVLSLNRAKMMAKGVQGHMKLIRPSRSTGAAETRSCLWASLATWRRYSVPTWRPFHHRIGMDKRAIVEATQPRRGHGVAILAQTYASSTLLGIKSHLRMRAKTWWLQPPSRGGAPTPKNFPSTKWWSSSQA